MICPSCGQTFVCPHADHEPHLCFGCSYSASMTDATARFAPLVAALRAQGVEPIDDEPWQTGGMVMCLAVPLTPDQTGDDSAYFLIGDEGQLGASLDVVYGHGLNLSPTTLGDLEREEDLAWDVDRSAAQAQWFASILPAIREWAATKVTYTSADEDGIDSEPWAEWTEVPSLPGTEVSTF